MSLSVVRRTKNMIEEEKRQILEYIHAGATDEVIMKGLNIPLRMYERRMKSIRQSHLKEVLNEQTAEAKASVMKLCQDKLKWLELQAQKIVVDAQARHMDKLEAMDRIRMFTIDQAKLIIEGPTIFRIVSPDGLHIGDKRTANELRDAPVLSESTQTNIPITDQNPTVRENKWVL
jgi:CheY-like chemotaxis protein